MTNPYMLFLRDTKKKALFSWNSIVFVNAKKKDCKRYYVSFFITFFGLYVKKDIHRP